MTSTPELPDTGPETTGSETTGAETWDIAIIGGGPAGLMAAEAALRENPTLTLCVFEAKPSLARKFLMAGKSGLNLTFNAPTAHLLQAYGQGADQMAKAIEAFDADAIQRWAEELGSETFVGSSGRVFPKAMKASPLLRAWLTRLAKAGARTALRHQWCGWDGEGHLIFKTGKEGMAKKVTARRTILALGGSSWARLGSDGRWVPLLEEKGVAITPWRPSNCGFEVPWSDHFRDRFAGTPLKQIALTHEGRVLRGEAMITERGIEGGVVYPLAAQLVQALQQVDEVTMRLDLFPDQSCVHLTEKLRKPQGKKSLSSHLRRVLRLEGVRANLPRELLGQERFAEQAKDPATLAACLKALPLNIRQPAPLDQAISTAGGIQWGDLSETYALKAHPHLYCVGEMIDWDAPTGGYLLTACLAQGRWAGQAAAASLTAET